MSAVTHTDRVWRTVLSDRKISVSQRVHNQRQILTAVNRHLTFTTDVTLKSPIIVTRRRRRMATNCADARSNSVVIEMYSPDEMVC